ncbi:hypothetical protein QUF64_11270 [Anaerolineales bacterium HSG6]|nr:hypothetical protein [Anaerolineales bacterium HSG6]MDM8531736.1 hypothetical protein [Anaerolineales bacterium HSG25]
MAHFNPTTRLTDSGSLDEFDMIETEGMLTSSQVRQELGRLFGRVIKRDMTEYEASLTE